VMQTGVIAVGRGIRKGKARGNSKIDGTVWPMVKHQHLLLKTGERSHWEGVVGVKIPREVTGPLRDKQNLGAHLGGEAEKGTGFFPTGADAGGRTEGNSRACLPFECWGSRAGDLPLKFAAGWDGQPRFRIAYTTHSRGKE